MRPLGCSRSTGAPSTARPSRRSTTRSRCRSRAGTGRARASTPRARRRSAARSGTPCAIRPPASRRPHGRASAARAPRRRRPAAPLRCASPPRSRRRAPCTGRISPRQRSVCPSSRRGGSLGKSGIGITRSFPSGDPERRRASRTRPGCARRSGRTARTAAVHIFVLRHRPPRQEVVGREDLRPARAEEQIVHRRRREPLHVQHVARLREQPRHPERVLDGLHRDPQLRPPEDASTRTGRRPRCACTRRRDTTTRANRNREVTSSTSAPARRKCRCELMVVGRREAGGVGEDDPSLGDERSLEPGAQPARAVGEARARRPAEVRPRPAGCR